MLSILYPFFKCSAFKPFHFINNWLNTGFLSGASCAGVSRGQAERKHMELTDLSTIEQWKQLEKNIARQFEIDANIFDTEIQYIVSGLENISSLKK